MKKVLASVLAGSMVLGMAAMASAAQSLTLKQGTGDYDYQLWLYEPKGSYDKENTSDYQIYAETQKAFDVFEAEYKKFTAPRTDKEIRDYFATANASSSGNVFDAYKEFYDLAKVDDAEKDGVYLADTLNLEDPSTMQVTNGAATAALGKDPAILGLTIQSGNQSGWDSSNPIAAAQLLTVLDDQKPMKVTFTGSNMTPSDIKSKLNSLKSSKTPDYGYGEYPYVNKSTIDIVDAKDHHMYTYGEDDAKEVTFEVVVKHGEDFRVDVASGKVTVSRKRIEADTKLDIDRYKIVIKAAAGVRDFELDDFKVELDCADNNTVYYIEGDVAYSDYREVLPDDRYIITKSNTDDLHNDGCVFDFSEVIDEETRIICSDYVDLLFKGNYGTDFENLRVMDDDIKEVEDFFQDYDIDYYDFIGTPKFAKDITVRIDADSDAYIYEYDKKTGDVVDITDECEYTSDGMTFKRKNLKTYVVLEEPYEGGNVKAEKEPVSEEPDDTDEPEPETPDDKDATGSKPNPGTGAYPLF